METLEFNSRLEGELALAKKNLDLAKNELALSSGREEELRGKNRLLERDNDGLRSLLNGLTSSPASSGFMSPKSMEHHHLMEQLRLAIDENERLKAELADALSKLDLAETGLKSVLKENEKLREKADKPVADSGNSGINPSSDPGKAYKQDRKKNNDLEPLEGTEPPKRRPGGQKNHTAFFHAPFTPENADKVISYGLPEGCCRAERGTELVMVPEKNENHDQYAMRRVSPLKLIHLKLAYMCPCCGKVHKGVLPPEVQECGLLDPNFLKEAFLLRSLMNASIRSMVS
ncbi:MAG: hypothetical protein LBR53_12675 [Deltaproteobacteria bacterium]|jgi:hypothetical protein|nr:hypothetical protein [Deltaproteobacteria bacterium]